MEGRCYGGKEEEKGRRKAGLAKSVLLYAHDMLYLLLIVMLLFLLVFRIIVVSGGSMRMTLLDGDYLLLLNNTFYHTPQRGDIVVISKESFDNGKPIVKRVIATEGRPWTSILRPEKFPWMARCCRRTISTR